MAERTQNLLRNLAEVTPKSIEWAWDGLVPLGKLTLLTGDPGAGKSFVALQVAAMVTQGRTTPWLEVGEESQPRFPPRAVVVLSAEDAADDTVLPRLKDAGADISNVFVLRGFPREDQDDDAADNSLRLTRDLPKLRASLRELEDAGVDVGLIVIDPIDRYFSPLDKKKDRIDVVARLANLAAESGAGILVIANSSMKAGSRGGTVAYQELLNSARSVLLVALDVENKDRRLVLPIKLNLSAMRPGLAFSIADGVIQWQDKSAAITADEHLRIAYRKQRNPLFREEQHEIDRVKKWLKEILTPGRASSVYIRTSAADYDIAYSTLRLAFKQLRCTATQQNKRWFWQLPDNEKSASDELLEKFLDTRDGSFVAITRESVPLWIQRENAAESDAQRESSLEPVLGAG